ncbi:MAG TPA: MFS transporter, partial [Spirochaetia bacterium]|nr:MFS transporter [Spirochaetia bacterium]
MNRRGRAAFLAASFFYWISQYVFVPTLPEYVRLRTAGLAAVGVVLSMYGLWQAIVRIPLGVAVDKTGWGKRFIIIGFAIGSVGTMVLAFGESQGVLTLGRALDGIAAGTWVPLVVVFSGLFPPREAVIATSLLTFSGSLGRMIATSLTGFLNNIGGFGLSFYVGAGAGIVAIVIVASTKTAKQDTREVSTSSILAVFKRPDVLLPSIIATVAQFGNWAVTYGFMSILAAQIGANGVIQGLLVSANILAMTIGNLFNTSATRRMSRTVLLYWSFLIFVAGIGIFAFGHSIPLFFLATMLMGLSNGFSYPT